MSFNEVLAVRLARDLYEWKAPVRAAATSPVSAVGLPIVNAIQLEEGDAYLRTNDGVLNGVWIASASTPHRRRADMDESRKFVTGMVVRAVDGTNAGTWSLTSTSVDLGTTESAWLKDTGTNAATSVQGANAEGFVRVATFASGVASILTLDASDVLSFGHDSLVDGIDIRADSLVRVFVGGTEAFGTDGATLLLTTPDLTWTAVAGAATIGQEQSSSGAGVPMQIAAQRGQTGANEGGDLLLGGGLAGTSGSAKAGDTVIDLGAPETAGDTTAVLRLKSASNTLLDIYSPDASAFAVALDTAGALTINGAPHARATASVNSAASPYTLTSPNATLIIDTSVANVTINFPTAVGVPVSCSIEVIHAVQGNDLFLEGNGAETVGGVATYDFSSPAIEWAVFRPIGGVWVRTLKELT